MKKFLLTLMAAAAVTSMSAQQFHLISKDDVNIKLPQITGNIPQVELGNGMSLSTRVAEKDLLGSWIFSYGDNFMEGATGQDLDIPYQAELQNSGGFNFIVFQGIDENPQYNEPPVAGIFDSSKNTLSLPTVGFGQFSGYYMFQFTGIYDWSLDDVVWQDLEIPYDPKTGILQFPEDAVIGWPAFADQQGQQFAGWFYVYSIYKASQPGMNGVEKLTDDFNGQPVYYNLSGVKVDNPQKGQLVIEKRGSNAKKVVF